MSSYKLTYFDIAGRAEPIRLAFAIGGIPFENHTVPFAEFPQLKQSGLLPQGQVPVLEIDGVRYPQSNSQLRYVGKVAGLYPEDPIDALKVDGYIDFADDFWMQIYVTLQRKKLNLPEYNEDEKKEAREHLANVTLPPLLQQMEDKLTENGTGWCVGNSCTIADLRWCTQVKFLQSGICDYVPASIVDPFPLTKALAEKVSAIPAVQAWYEAEAKRKETA